LLRYKRGNVTDSHANYLKEILRSQLSILKKDHGQHRVEGEIHWVIFQNRPASAFAGVNRCNKCWMHLKVNMS